MIARSLWVTGVVMGCLSGACGSPRDASRPPDTLVVQPVTPAPVAYPVPDDPALRDSLGYRFRAFVGSEGRAALPELAMVAVDGRRAGFDPATKRPLLQLPGADYFSTPTPGDDDAVRGDSAAARTEGVIDSRELEVPSHAGERYTLEVVATDAGTFVLNLHLYANRGGASADKEMPALAFGRGQVRRFAVQIGAGTMDVSELHSP